MRGSTSNNITGSYRHEAVDFRAAGDPASCRSCGGAGAPGGAALPCLTLQRYHRYDWAAQPSSLGPGVFTTFDQSLKIQSDGTLAWYDPAGSFPVILSPSTGDPSIYINASHDLVKAVTFAGATGSPVAKTAASATIAMYDGREYRFEFVNLSSTQRVGRLTSLVDTAGRITLVSHRYTADYTNTGFDPAHLWDIDSVTDASGRSISFDSSATLVGGRAVIERAHLPTGDTIFYWYNQAPLGLTGGTDIQGFSGATLPGGDTVSVVAAVDGDLVRLTVDDPAAEGTHRRKTVWVTKPGTVDARTQSTIGYQIRRIDNGAGETIYRSRVEQDGDLWTTIIESGGELTRLAYTATGAPVHAERATAWDWAQPTSTYTWEASDTWTYDATKRPMASANALGASRSAVYDPVSGQPSAITYEDGTTETFEYNALGLPVVHVDRAGRRTESTFDARGNPLSRTEAAGTPDAVTTSSTYNSLGLVTSTTDARGFTTTYAYTAEGWLESITEPADVAGGPQAITRFTYDTLGRRLTMVDPGLRTTTYTWDPRGRLIGTTYADGSTETVTYGTGVNANLPVRKTDRNGRVTLTAYDAAGRPVESRIAASATAPDAGQTTVLEAITYQPGTSRPLTVVRDGSLTSHAYDHRGREIATTAWATGTVGLTTTSTYDVGGRLVAQTDAFNRRSLMVYDINDRVVRTIRELVPGGVATGADLATLPRDAAPNPAYIIEESSYDADGQLIERRDGRNIATRFIYDNQGRQTGEVVAFGTADAATSATIYDAAGNRTDSVSPGGRRTTWTYTGRNLVASETQAAQTGDAATVTYSYTLTRKLATTSDPRNAAWITENRYGGCCDRLRQTIDASGAITAFGYDFVGNRTSTTDPLSNTTAVAYDVRNRPITVTNALNETVTTVYDDNLTDGVGLDAPGSQVAAIAAEIGLAPGIADGAAVAVTNAFNETTIQVQDALGYTVATIDPRGKVSRMAYDILESTPSGVLVAARATDPLGRTRIHWADAAGRTRRSQDPAGQITVATFDANGNRLSQTDPVGVGIASAVFDARGREVSVTDTAGATTQRHYSADNDLVEVIDALGKSETFNYDQRGRKTSQTDRVGATTRFSYDAANNLIALSDAENEARTGEAKTTGSTDYVFDSRGLLVAETFPLGQAGRTRRLYAYDLARRLASRTVGIADPASPTALLATPVPEVTGYGYDNANRLTERRYPDGKNDLFTFDAAGRMITARSARYRNTVLRSYDLAGRLTSESLSLDAGTVLTGAVLPGTWVTTYGWDDANQKVQITLPDGRVETRAYTARGQVEQVWLDAASMTLRTYDAAGRMVAATAGNGLVETRTYVPGDHLVATIKVPGVTDFSYTYDALKRKTAENVGIAQASKYSGQTFDYDSASRLTTWAFTNQATKPPKGSTTVPVVVVDSQQWTLSPVGDWASTTKDGVVEIREHTAVHETTVVGGLPLAYDFKGNLTQDDKGQRYTWDFENRLAKADNLPASTPYRYKDTAFYLYDALGRRVQKQWNERATTFVPDGAQVTIEQDSWVLPMPEEVAADGDLGRMSGIPEGGSILAGFTATSPGQAGSAVVRINFQPATTVVPEGYVADKGRIYGTRSNGLSYGWQTRAQTPARERQRAALPQYDSHVQISGSTVRSRGTWSIALPNGDYPVIVVCGDPSSLAQANDLVIAGQTVSDPDPYDPLATPGYEIGDFDGYAVIAHVTNGQLTIAPASSASNAKICFIEIGAAGQSLTQDDLDRLASQVHSMTQSTGGPAWPQRLPNPRVNIFGDYIDDVVAMVERAPSATKAYFLHANHLFSPAAATSASASVVERYRYSAYGERTILTPGGVVKAKTTIANDWGFTGREIDEETGLMYFRARYYSGGLGRFNGRDPARYTDGVSLYGAYFVPRALDPDGNRVVDRGMRREKSATVGGWGHTVSTLDLPWKCMGCPTALSTVPNRWSGVLLDLRVNIEIIIDTEFEYNGIRYRRSEANIQRTITHEKKHKAVFEGWHRANEQAINRDLNTGAIFTSYEDCEAYMLATSQFYQRDWTETRKGEVQHSTAGWAGFIPTSKAEEVPDSTPLP